MSALKSMLAAMSGEEFADWLIELGEDAWPILDYLNSLEISINGLTLHFSKVEDGAGGCYGEFFCLELLGEDSQLMLESDMDFLMFHYQSAEHGAGDYDKEKLGALLRDALLKASSEDLEKYILSKWKIKNSLREVGKEYYAHETLKVTKKANTYDSKGRLVSYTESVRDVSTSPNITNYYTHILEYNGLGQTVKEIIYDHELGTFTDAGALKNYILYGDGAQYILNQLLSSEEDAEAILKFLLDHGIYLYDADGEQLEEGDIEDFVEDYFSSGLLDALQFKDESGQIDDMTQSKMRELIKSAFTSASEGEVDELIEDLGIGGYVKARIDHKHEKLEVKVKSMNYDNKGRMISYIRGNMGLNQPGQEEHKDPYPGVQFLRPDNK